MPNHSATRRACTGAAAVALACAATLSLTGSAAAQPSTADDAPVGRATTSAVTAAASSKAHVPTGYDISWPNCPKGLGIRSRPTQGKPLPSAKTDFVVIGLTNGPGFSPNPCLDRQVRWAKKHHVWTAPYAFTTYPTAKQVKKYRTKGPYQGSSTATRLHNTGYAEAMFNVASMKKVDLESTFI